MNTSPGSPPLCNAVNRLAREKSPYLQQHRHNPVDWYPWGEEAFARAQGENKPIFLSIGYSTCHWCHVMERESFEDQDVARFLNRHFVSIKVDREERPDVDKIYMTFVQSQTGSGGWPLNVFLTPGRLPFYGGTYFPPDGKHGRPGFLQLLQQIQKLWMERPKDLLTSASEVHARLGAVMNRPPASGMLLHQGMLNQAVVQMKGEFDPENGGFGGAPKFPQPSQPSLLLRCATRQNDREAVEMVLHTCERMAAGGIHDQLGGGFARYSVDAHWLVPHFEKMLYDNAQLLHLYLDAFLVSGRNEFAEVARGIVTYVLRDMTHPEGGFYSAEDADSEGKEGKFYCWTEQELRESLSPDEFRLVARYYGVTAEGNFVDHSDPDPLPGQNVLSVVHPDLSSPDRIALERACDRLFNLRTQRVRPHLDDKVLSSWNGLMLGAVARAGIILGEEAWLAAAERNAAFLRDKLWDSTTQTLYHRWREGERDSVQLLDAYACLLDGVVHLYEATLRPEHLEFAVSLAESMIARFYDSASGGFWQGGTESKDLILRVKEDYDGAEPSGNSVAVTGLLRLAMITGREDLAAPAQATLRFFSERMAKIPQAVPWMLGALDFQLHEPKRIVIAGQSTSGEARSLLRAAHAVYQPNKVVLGTVGPVEATASAMKPPGGGAAAFVCTGSACLPPITDPAELKRVLTTSS